MAALAKPFAFDDLDRPGPAPAPLFSATDLNAAREKAEADAAASLLVAEAEKQTRLLQIIADRLDAMAADYNIAIAGEIEALTAAARSILKKICISMAAAQQTDTALALLNQYLSKITDQTPATLALPAATAPAALSKLKKSVSGRGAADFVTITARDDVAEGDCRIEWRGGAAIRSSEDTLRQIDSIFNGAPKPSRKGKTS